MILLWLVLGWWTIGIAIVNIGSVWFDKELTVGGLIASTMLGLFGPLLLFFFVSELITRYEHVVLWKKEKCK